MDRDNLAARLVCALRERSMFLAAAESCTAGLLADCIGRVPGASECFWGSFVTYTAAAKIRMLGLDARSLERHGLVSAETACAMARAALETSGCDAAVSVTGLAGPGGDGSAVPVGTVWIGTAFRARAEVRSEVFHYSASRNEVRQLAAGEALNQILQQLEK